METYNINEQPTNKHVSADGRFNRLPSLYNDHFGDGNGEIPVEPNRYIIYWSPVCPWAHRNIIVRSLLGLDDVVGVRTLDPIRPNVGRVDWAFTLDKNNIDPVLGIYYLSEIYYQTNPSHTGGFTVPCVVDIKSRKVVNNNYYDLTLEWETRWTKYHKKGALDLYPIELREEIDKLNRWLFDNINNGVYKAGFSRSQEAYADAVENVFKAFDVLEERLSHQRYLFGDRITDSDVRLYVTLARFDIAYFNAFRVNKKMLRDYDNLWRYARDLNQTKGFGDTTDFDAIKKHSHLCCAANPKKILPLGPDLSVWNIPSGRDTQKYR